MYKVYWTNPDVRAEFTQNFGKEFEDMTEALNYCQHIRRNGAKFVTMCSELADMVGEFGVKDVDEGYNWTKRR